MAENVKLIGIPINNFLCIYIIASSPGLHTLFCFWRVNKKLPQGKTSQNRFQRSRSISWKCKIHMVKWAHPPLKDGINESSNLVLKTCVIIFIWLEIKRVFQIIKGGNTCFFIYIFPVFFIHENLRTSPVCGWVWGVRERESYRGERVLCFLFSTILTGTRLAYGTKPTSPKCLRGDNCMLLAHRP